MHPSTRHRRRRHPSLTASKLGKASDGTLLYQLREGPPPLALKRGCGAILPNGRVCGQHHFDFMHVWAMSRKATNLVEVTGIVYNTYRGSEFIPLAPDAIQSLVDTTDSCSSQLLAHKGMDRDVSRLDLPKRLSFARQ